MARLNTAMAPLALRIRDGTVSDAVQQDYAQRLMAAGEWMRRRAKGARGAVSEGEVLAGGALTLPTPIVEPYWER